MHRKTESFEVVISIYDPEHLDTKPPSPSTEHMRIEGRRRSKVYIMRKKKLSCNKRIPRTVPRRRFRENRKGTKRRTKASAKRQHMYLVAMKGFRSRAGVVPMTRMYMKAVLKVAHGAVGGEER